MYMKRKYNKRRFSFYKNLVKILFFPIKTFVYKFKAKNKYKIKKNESVFVLSNHQTDVDPILVNYSFNKLVSPVATDTLFSNKFASKFLPYAFGVIPKKKGAVDSQATIKILRLLKDGGSVLLFPEGNRTVAEFQFYINPKLASFIKKTNATLILYNMEGGVGVNPRFGNKLRKGKFSGEIKKVLKPSEYLNLSDDELIKIIKDNIKVFDSYTEKTFKSKKSAEYLERLLFVCPKCGSLCTLESCGQEINCKKCDLKVKYNKYLKFESSDKDFRFVYLNDWYQFQKKWIKEHDFNQEMIFSDDNVELYLSNPYQKRKCLAKGQIVLTNKFLKCGDFELEIAKIQSASVIGGRKFSFSTDDNGYLVVGKERFNPFKYVLLFNKLDTKMKEKSNDEYFNLEEDL